MLTIFICSTYQSLRIVDDPAFRNFVTNLNPKYTLMSRKTLTTSLLPEFYESACIKLMNLLANATYVAITADCWTSCSNQSFLGVTCHFWENRAQGIPKLQSRALEVAMITTDETALSLSALLREIFEIWNIESKVVAIVTDHAPNMKATAEKLGIRHLGCYAHALNTVVKTSISTFTDESVTNVIQKTKNIVTYFNHCAKGTRLLKAVNDLNLEDGERPPLKLKQYVDTRWNTLHDMICSVLENRDGVSKTLLQIDIKNIDKILSDDEVLLLKDICMIIQPFKQAIEKVSGDSYVTLSSIIPSIKGIRVKLARVVAQTTCGNMLLQHFIQGTKNKLCDYELKVCTRVTTILDPRFKKSAFYYPSNCEEAVKCVKQMLNASLAKKEKYKESSTTVQPQRVINASIPEDYIYSHLKEVPCTVWEVRRNTNTGVVATNLLDNFLVTENMSIAVDSDFVISSLRQKHPELYEIFMQFSVIPGSSVPCERLFSNTGFTLNDRRNRLSGKHLNMIVFLNKNSDLLKN